TIKTPIIAGHPVIEGVTPTGATGTGKLVFDTSPTLVTPTIGAASGTSLTLSGLYASAPVFSDGSKKLVSNAITGTGRVVMDTSPTIKTPIIAGHPVIEGVTPTGATGTGKLVFDTSPTLVTPNIGAATGTSLTLSGLTASLPVFSDGSKKLISKSVADTRTALGVGAETAWQAFAACAEVGWDAAAGGSPTELYYKKVGKLVFVHFSKSGTSDNATTTLTIPDTYNGTVTLQGVCIVQDNGGAYTPGKWLIQTGTNYIKFYKDLAEGAFTASGIKSVEGSLCYALV
ncbi:MAG: hypothetical protein WC554_16990, partial [Clostridia bacterium]